MGGLSRLPPLRSLHVGFSRPQLEARAFLRVLRFPPSRRFNHGNKCHCQYSPFTRKESLLEEVTDFYRNYFLFQTHNLQDSHEREYINCDRYFQQVNIVCICKTKVVSWLKKIMWVIGMSGSKSSNSPSQDSNHLDYLFQSSYVTPGFKPFSCK